MAYDDIILSTAKQFNLDPDLIRAFIRTESNWNPNATRYEAKLNDTSYGLMQILLGTAKWVGDNAAITAEQLANPTVNVLLGGKYLRYLVDKYQGRLSDVIASYNAGRPYKTASGKYTNQSYVDKVMAYYSIYKWGWITGGVVALVGASIFLLFYLRKSRR